MSRSLRTVKSATQSPPPAESPAITIFSGFTALCGAFGSGLVKYRSGTFLVSVAGRVKKFTWDLHAAITSCLELAFVSVYIYTIAKKIELTMDTARDTVELYGS